MWTFDDYDTINFVTLNSHCIFSSNCDYFKSPHFNFISVRVLVLYLIQISRGQSLSDLVTSFRLSNIIEMPFKMLIHQRNFNFGNRCRFCFGFNGLM
jgi:hypothetical protein